MKSGLRLLPLVFLLASAATAVHAAEPGDAAEPASTAERIVGAALVDSRAWDKLAYLTDRIGHRFSGSVGLERAVDWAAAEFRRDGIERVWTEKVMVPRWVRGHGAVRVMSPVEWDAPMLALGGSVGTPPDGITAPVVEVTSFEELEALAGTLAGKIVLYNRKMEPGWGVKNGYGTVVKLRAHGASRAAKYGALGILLRSLGTADFRTPHTGAMRYDEKVPKIPAAAIDAESAGLIHRLLASGDEVRVRMDLGSKTLEDVESANVIAELQGREKPEEIVLIGAHLDSWDVGQGAHDDGAGCAVVMETMRLLQRLDHAPRRTVRAVLFTNEENGLRGGKSYAERHGDEPHVAAIEMDTGGFRPIGFGVSAGEGGLEMVREILRPLETIGASRVFDGGGGADIGPLRKLGIPTIGQRVEGAYYFDYHHSAADTLDKVDRGDLDRNVAAMAVLAYGLAESEEALPPLEPEKEEK